MYTLVSSTALDIVNRKYLLVYTFIAHCNNIAKCIILMLYKYKMHTFTMSSISKHDYAQNIVATYKDAQL